MGPKSTTRFTSVARRIFHARRGCGHIAEWHARLLAGVDLDQLNHLLTKLRRVRGLGIAISDAFFENNKVSAKRGQLQFQANGGCSVRLSTLFKPDARNPLASPRPQGLSARKSAENSALDNEVLVNPSLAHAELIATFRRADLDAAQKFGLIKAVGKKGPKAIQAAVETAAKAAKRRDSYARKLKVLGVSLKD